MIMRIKIRRNLASTNTFFYMKNLSNWIGVRVSSCIYETKFGKENGPKR